MHIRTATEQDLDRVAAVEAECFPPAEAATRAEFAQRIAHYGNHFWLMFDGDELIAGRATPARCSAGPSPTRRLMAGRGWC